MFFKALRLPDSAKERSHSCLLLKIPLIWQCRIAYQADRGIVLNNINLRAIQTTSKIKFNCKT
jgi:hypothetical protein